MRVGRSSIARIALMVALILLAIVLLWHLFGMVHSEGMGILGGCLFLLVAALVLAVPRIVRPFALLAEMVPPRGWITATEPVSRPPPDEGSLQGVVLIC